MQSIIKVLWGNGQSEVVTKRIAPGLHAYGRCGTISTKPMLYDSEPLCVVQIHVHWCAYRCRGAFNTALLNKQYQSHFRCCHKIAPT